jgi:hypothetical protein
MGVIHRDIKPGNILIENSSLITHDSSLRIWITDFGLAQFQAGADLTMTGDLIGTLRYMSPGDQIIHQDTFTVPPGTNLDKMMRIGMTDHEPTCLVEGLRRVLDREVELHFHKVVPVGQGHSSRCSR